MKITDKGVTPGMPEVFCSHLCLLEHHETTSRLQPFILSFSNLFWSRRGKDYLQEDLGV